MVLRSDTGPPIIALVGGADVVPQDTSAGDSAGNSLAEHGMR